MAAYRGRSTRSLDAMSDAVATAFVICVVYAVLGNVVLLFLLQERDVPFTFMWAGVPGYLYRRAVQAGVAGGLRWFACSTVIAFVLAFPLGMVASGGSSTP